VWGPPGTGKTEVIALALQRLLEKGRSVLLVSGTNVAVDNALQRVVGAVQPPPRRLVRVGTPQIADIAEDIRSLWPA
jgi:superfamily I DNA/RNA helicase